MDSLLFSSGADWQSNALINVNHSPIRYYIDGYKRAADILVKNVLETSIDQDVLVYPIVFLYRQCVELQLKDLIRESRILLGEGSSFPSKHNIKNLWDISHQLMKRIITDVDKSAGDYIAEKDFIKINEVISSFTEVDPESIAFRYPEDRSGNNTMQGLTHISIRKLAEHINDLVELLDKCDLVVSCLRESQLNMDGASC